MIENRLLRRLFSPEVEDQIRAEIAMQCVAAVDNGMTGAEIWKRDDEAGGYLVPRHAVRSVLRHMVQGPARDGTTKDKAAQRRRERRIWKAWIRRSKVQSGVTIA